MSITPSRFSAHVAPAEEQSTRAPPRPDDALPPSANGFSSDVPLARASLLVAGRLSRRQRHGGCAGQQWRCDGQGVVSGTATVSPDSIERLAVREELAEPRFDEVPPRPNTHNLGWTEDADGAPDRQGGCGPVAVGGSFEVVVAHLAAYDAGVGA